MVCASMRLGGGVGLWACENIILVARGTLLGGERVVDRVLSSIVYQSLEVLGGFGIIEIILSGGKGGGGGCT